MGKSIRKLNQNEADLLIAEHELWLKGGESPKDAYKRLSGSYDFSNLELKNANLQNSNISGSDFTSCNLRYTNFARSELRDCNFYKANAKDVNFFHSELKGSRFEGIKTNEYTSFFYSICPEQGEFIGWKKCMDGIVKLLIPDDAFRCSATTYRCRADKVKVLEIEGNDNTLLLKTVSGRNKSFKYVVGETITIDGFSEDRFDGHSEGIHFFMTKELAEKY